MRGRQPDAPIAPAESHKRLVFDVMATRALDRVAAALREGDIPCAPVKGVVLARWLYRDVTERPYVDVDLLVPRATFERARALVEARGWPLFYRTSEMGELGFHVERVAVELHAEVGRRDLSRLTVADLLGRARLDRETFPFPILHLDDVDHFLLLVLNVVKDGFTYANPHQPADLARLLDRLTPRWEELVQRAAEAGLTTALHLTGAWMERRHGSTAFAQLRRRLPPPKRALFLGAAGLHARLDRRRDGRLRNVGGLLGLALATLVPDPWSLRGAGLLRVLRRGAARRFGRDPG